MSIKLQTINFTLPAEYSYDETDKVINIKYNNKESFFTRLPMKIMIEKLTPLTFDLKLLQFDKKRMEKTLLTTFNNVVLDLKSDYITYFKVFYTHFPFKIEIKETHLTVTNFLGYKKSIIVNKPADIIVTKLDDISYEVKGINRQKVGNFIFLLENIRKRVNNFLDHRKFKDCIYRVNEISE